MINFDDYRKLDVIDQEHLCNSFDGSKKSWERLALCLCHMAKVGYPWTCFVAKLQGNPAIQALQKGDGKSTQSTPFVLSSGSLFLWLLSVSDDGVKRHLIREQMKHQPVPLMTGWPSPRCCLELLWTMREVPALGSFKLNGKVKGVSKLLDGLFHTDFETDGGQRGSPSHPFAQIQFDEDMKPPNCRQFAVIDMHGAGSLETTRALASTCQFVMLHICTKDLRSRDIDVPKFVNEIASHSQCKLVFLVIWDDVCKVVEQEDAVPLFHEKAGEFFAWRCFSPVDSSTKLTCKSVRFIVCGFHLQNWRRQEKRINLWFRCGSTCTKSLPNTATQISPLSLVLRVWINVVD